MPLGSIPELPAGSCGEIKASEGRQAVNSNYWLDNENDLNPSKLYFDMKIDGDKWWLIPWVKALLRSFHSFALDILTAHNFALD